MRRIRALTPNERSLWAHVAKSVKRVKRGDIKAEMSMQELLEPTLLEPIVEPVPALETKAILAQVVSVIPVIKPQNPPLEAIERSLRRTIKRGKTQIDAKLDLHGLYQDEAHQALLSFIGRSRQKGHNLVLIVTGKGGKKLSYDTYSETGILRRLVPIWLSDASLRQSVIGFEEAALNHGGAGALYLRLRRNK